VLDPHDPQWQTKAWNIYYQQPSAAAIALGKEFAARFDVQYEWVAFPSTPSTPQQFHDKLTIGPIQIATAVCPGWNSSTEIQGCGSGVQHATLMDFVEPSGTIDIRDHYVPFEKKFASNYTIPYAMRFICVAKTAPVPPQGFSHHFVAPILLGQSGTEVVALQDALKASGDFPLTVASTGYYGSITQKAVLAFQRKYQVDTPAVLTQLNGTRVGLKTIAQLNALFNK
jgi:hypothetical protein